MTRPEAEAIIRLQREGHPVNALLLQEAIRATRRKADNRSNCLPPLPSTVRDRVNAVLLLNLGLAMGRTLQA